MLIDCEDKYYEIIGASDAWLVNEDYSEGSLKPTNSALRIRDLFDQVTGELSILFFCIQSDFSNLDRYRPLPDFSYRLAFLLGIQVPLLEAYHLRISSAIDAIETLSIGIMRAVPGALGDSASSRLTAGVPGLQRLLRALVSAKWMSSTCRTWEDDVVRNFQIVPVISCLQNE